MMRGAATLVFVLGLVGAARALSVPLLPRITVPDIAGPDITVPGAGIAKSVVNSTVDAAAPDDVCFGYLGCFSMSQPWYSLLRPLPKPHSPDMIDTKFYLYTRASTRRCNVTKLPEVSLEGSKYDGKKTTFFITHGFASDGNSSWLSEMKDAILTKFDANVFLVDWGKGASLLNYFQVASNTRVVGAELARLAQHLIDNEGSDPSRLHLIGHSLGAHISSYVAKMIPNVAKLTALDPAQPAFENFNKAVRLDKSDAQFVQVLHTNSRPFIPLIGLGMMGEHGHVDLYLNGGWTQPGCILPPKPNITSFLDLATVPVEVLSNFISCPHGRSYEVFTASMMNDNCTFWGHVTSIYEVTASILTGGYLSRKLIPSNNCSATTCVPLGVEAIDYPARGLFNVATTSHLPFCVHEPVVDAKMRQYRKQA